MAKKALIIIILIAIILNFSPIYGDTFSQTNVVLKATRKSEDIFVHILTPLSIKQIKAEVVSTDGRIKAIIYRDYFAIRNYSGKKYNEYIISSKNNDIFESDTIKIVYNSEIIAKSEISHIPYNEIKKSEIDNTNSIRIMTYNIHRGRDKAGNSNLEQIGDFIQYYDIDIIGLQEVDKNVSRTSFEDQLKIVADKLSMYCYFGANKSFLRGEYGNGILSRYPLQSPENIILNGKEPRGLLKTTILLDDNKKLKFMVTHLGLDVDERQSQFNTILDYIDIYEDDMVLVGDFNVVDSDSNVVKIQQRLNDVGEKTIHRYKNTLNIFRNEYRIDYIFTSKIMKIKKYKVEKVQYSDHFPVIVDIDY